MLGKWIQAAVGIRLVAETGFAPSQPGVVVMGLAQDGADS